MQIKNSLGRYNYAADQQNSLDVDYDHKNKTWKLKKKKRKVHTSVGRICKSVNVHTGHGLTWLFCLRPKWNEFWRLVPIFDRENSEKRLFKKNKINKNKSCPATPPTKKKQLF